MLVRVGLLAAAVTLAFAASATAGGPLPRYAEPGGNGPNPCVLADPCDIETAVESAPANSLVRLLGGTYILSNTLSIANDTNVLADDPSTPVTIQSTADIAVHLAFTTNSVLSDITIDHDTSSVNPTLALQVEGGTAQRIFVHSTGSNYACYVSGLIRDTVCFNDSVSGGGGVALFNSVDLTGQMINVTAVATGTGGSGLFVHSTVAGADILLRGTNVIADGAFDQRGVAAAGSTADIDLSFSIFDDNALNFQAPATGTLTTENDNLSSATEPALLDANFRQLPGSPTIDAGFSDPGIGITDIDGEPREQNGVPDIGADESDGVAPDTEITKKPPKRTKRRTAVFEFESEEPGVDFDCKIDGKPFKPCDSGTVKYKRLARRKHTFQVRADDEFNVDATPDTYTWKIRKKK